MLQLIEEKANKVFRAKIYEGYGYQVTIEIFDDDLRTASIKPIENILKQPGISVVNNKAYALFEDISAAFTAENIHEIMQYTQNAHDLMKELDERFNEL